MVVVKTALSMSPKTWSRLDRFAQTQDMNRSEAVEILLGLAFGLVEA